MQDGKLSQDLEDLVCYLYDKYKNVDENVSREDVDHLQQQLSEHHTNSTKRSIERSVKLLTLLRTRSNEQHKKSEPKIKFKFSRRVTSEVLSSSASNPPSIVTAVNSKDQLLSVEPPLNIERGVKLNNLTNQTIVFGPDELHGNDLTLENLDHCLIILNDRTGAIRGHHIQNCILIASLVESSGIFYGIVKSLVIIKSLQLRIHECEEAIFLSSTRSPPIIEKSFKLQFGHLPSFFLSPDDKSFNTSEIEVKDFNWHRQNEKSPHWISITKPIELNITEGLTKLKETPDEPKHYIVPESTIRTLHDFFQSLA